MEIEIVMRVTGVYIKIWHKKDSYYDYHREDGPAIIWGDTGEEEWYLHGINYDLDNMPLNLFLAYVKWEYRKKNGN